MDKKKLKAALIFFGVCFVIGAVAVTIKMGITEVGHYEFLDFVPTGYKFFWKYVEFDKVIPLLIGGVVCFVASACIKVDESGQTVGATVSADQNVQMGSSDEYKPISMWGYFGYEILFALPLIGWIILIVKALSARNVNLRNFARSYFCLLIILSVIAAISLANSGVQFFGRSF